MSCTIIFFALILQGLGSHIKDQPTSIINGDLANIEDYPYYVLIRNFMTDGGVGSCGGTILKPNVILTAAHCVVQSRNLFVYPGLNVKRHIYFIRGYRAKMNISHPSYNGSDYLSSMYDLALLKLEKSITLGPTAQIIEIAGEDLKIGDEVAIVGYGKVICTEFVPGVRQCIDPGPKRLRSAIVKVRDLSLNIIITYRKNQGACYGDSGGPMVYDGKIIGVASATDTRNCSGMSVYTRPSANENKEWIEKVIQQFEKEDEVIKGNE